MNDETESDLEKFGAPKDLIDKNPEEDFFEVEPDAWPAVEIFLKLQTQWIPNPAGGIMGLNYVAVSFVFDVYKIENRAEMLEDLRMIELGVLSKIKESGQ